MLGGKHSGERPYPVARKDLETGSRGISLTPVEVVRGSDEGGRDASLGLDTHHRAVGSAVDRRRLRPPI